MCFGSVRIKSKNFTIICTWQQKSVQERRVSFYIKEITKIYRTIIFLTVIFLINEYNHYEKLHVCMLVHFVLLVFNYQSAWLIFLLVNVQESLSNGQKKTFFRIKNNFRTYLRLSTSLPYTIRYKKYNPNIVRYV